MAASRVGAASGTNIDQHSRTGLAGHQPPASGGPPIRRPFYVAARFDHRGFRGTCGHEQPTANEAWQCAVRNMRFGEKWRVMKGLARQVEGA